MGDHTLFFYGTLLHPPILHRVIHGPANPSFPSPSTSYIRTAPATLPAHRRHRVRGADYPAIVPTSPPASASPDESPSVRGTLATGLTAQDVRRLDIFEGSEYARRRVAVRVLRRPDREDVSAEAAAVDSQLASELVEDGEETMAETYVWISGRDRLEETEWDFETFKREKMRFWIGEGGEEGDVGREEFSAVDAGGGADGTGGRKLDGHISRELEREYRGGEGAVEGAR